MGKQRIIKAISSVVKPPKGGFFVLVIHFPDIISYSCPSIIARRLFEWITA
jgi:hypothetical protein